MLHSLKLLALSVGISIGGFASHASAATAFWDCEGNVANLSNATNWVGDVAPVAGDSLVFQGRMAFTGITFDYAANTVFNGLTFATNAVSFSTAGTNNVINLGGDIAVNSLNAQSLGVPMALTATRNVNVASQYGVLTLSGVISETGGSGFGITKTGNGLLTLSGANTFTGPVTISGGTLAIASDSTGAANPLGSGAVGANSLTINGGALRTTATTQLSINRGVLLGSSTAGSGGALDVNSGTLTYNGVLANNGGTNSLTKTGVGTLVLGGVNTYSGNTNLNHGTLKLDFTQLAGTSSDIINSSSTLILGGATTALGNANATGATTSIAGTTLNMTSKSASNSTQTFNGVTLNGGYHTIQTTQTSGGNNLLTLNALTHTYSPTANTGYNASYGGLVNFSFAGTLGASNAIKTTTNNVNGILGGWATYGSTNPISSYAANDSSGNIVPYTGYIAQAAGAITSSASTNYQVQSAGAIALSTPDAATTDVNTLSLSSAATGVTTITIGTAGASSTGILRVGATGGFLAGSTAGRIQFGDVANNGFVTSGGADNTAGEINFIGSNTTTNAFSFDINSKIADNGTGAVSVTYGGTQGSGGSIARIFGTNTYTGGTTITTGRIFSNTAGGFGTGSVTVYSGAQAYIDGTTYPNNWFIAGAGTSITNGNPGFYDTPGAIRFNSGNVVLSGTVTLLNDAAINSRNTSGSNITGKITGNYNLTITSSGTTGGNTKISNTGNDWGGNLLIETKTLLLGASGVIPNGAGKGNVVLTNGAASILDLNGFNETINGLTSLGAAPFVQNNQASTTATLTIGDGDASSTFAGTIRDNSGTGGTVSLVKIGSGIQSLNGNNTFTGGLSVKSGTVFNDANTTGFGAATGLITLGDTSGTSSAGILVSNVGRTIANPITVAAGSSGTKSIATVGGGQAFTFSGPVTLNGALAINTFAGNTNTLALSGAISGSSSITITANGGAVALSGTSPSYSGTTTVAAGTLLVTGSISGSSTTVDAGTIGGTGTVGAVIVNSAGSMAPGLSIGTLNSGNLALNGTAQFKLEINTTTSVTDLVNVTGNLSLDAGNTVVLSLSELGSNVALAQGTTLTFIDYSGTWNGGTFAGLADDSTFTFGANQFQISYNGVTGTDTAVTLSVVPEPGAAVALLGGLGLLLGLHRRKQR